MIDSLTASGPRDVTSDSGFLDENRNFNDKIAKSLPFLFRMSVLDGNRVRLMGAVTSIMAVLAKKYTQDREAEFGTHTSAFQKSKSLV